MLLPIQLGPIGIPEMESTVALLSLLEEATLAS